MAVRSKLQPPVVALFLALAVSSVLTGCPEEGAKDVPVGQAGGVLSGTIYWTSVDLEIHKLNLATGDDKTLGLGHRVSRAPDGKLVIVGKTGIEESDEALISTRVIKEDKFSAEDSTQNYNDINVSPDGTRIAYDTLGNGSYVCLRADGTLLASFKVPGATNAFLRPTWTPDGRVVVGGGFDNPGIYVSDAALMAMTRIDPNLDQPRSPVVSPDGTRVAFVLKKLVFAINIDGTGLLQIDTDDASDDRWPQWSPDGKSIAYYGNTGTMKIRPSTGGPAIDVVQTYPALKGKRGVFGTHAPFQWVP